MINSAVPLPMIVAIENVSILSRDGSGRGGSVCIAGHGSCVRGRRFTGHGEKIRSTGCGRTRKRDGNQRARRLWMVCA
jgi:hypothetical protein